MLEKMIPFYPCHAKNIQDPSNGAIRQYHVVHLFHPGSFVIIERSRIALPWVAIHNDVREKERIYWKETNVGNEGSLEVLVSCGTVSL